MNIPQNRQVIAGIGSALVDLCISESREFVDDSGAQMGGMVMVEHTVIDNILSKTAQKPSVVPGGSACNTIGGVGRLGGRARFVGKRGDDELGRALEESLTKAGVEPVLMKSASATGRVLAIVTPDAQRSMLTCLGASAEIRPEEIKREYFEDCAIVHIEGYLLFNPAVFTAAVTAAKEAGALVSLDLASYTVVEASKSLIQKALDDGMVDILIANEDEAKAFVNTNDNSNVNSGNSNNDDNGNINANENSLITALGQKVSIAVMNMGKRGSVIIHNNTITKVPVHKECVPVDTTGAGDLWIAGFLHGLVSGYGIAKAGALGAACGYEVCQVTGASIPAEGWRKIRNSEFGIKIKKNLILLYGIYYIMYLMNIKCILKG